MRATRVWQLTSCQKRQVREVSRAGARRYRLRATCPRARDGGDALGPDRPRRSAGGPVAVRCDGAVGGAAPHGEDRLALRRRGRLDRARRLLHLDHVRARLLRAWLERGADVRGAVNQDGISFKTGFQLMFSRQAPACSFFRGAAPPPLTLLIWRGESSIHP